MEVYLTDKAAGQLKDAARWWAERRSVEQSQSWYEGFLRSLETLASQPFGCPIARESNSFPFELRELFYGLSRRKTHRAIYVVRPDRIVVYAIRHLAQDDIKPDDL